MGLRLTAHQPVLQPWLGLLAKIADADLFCRFDLCPQEDSGHENRQRIKTQAGIQWLTVPVRRSRETPIKDLLIATDHAAWQRKHWRTIELAYQRAPYWKQYSAEFRELLMRPWEKLADLDGAMLDYFCRAFGIKTPMVRASDYPLTGTKSDLVLSMCRHLGATVYVFGSQGRDYADVPAFEAAGVRVEFQEYKHPEYPQLHGGFIPYMGALDLLFNVGGGETGLDVIMSGQIRPENEGEW